MVMSDGFAPSLIRLDASPTICSTELSAVFSHTAKRFELFGLVFQYFYASLNRSSKKSGAIGSALLVCGY